MSRMTQINYPTRSGSDRAPIKGVSRSVLAGALLLLALPALAQVSSYGDKQMGETAEQQPQFLSKVTITQNLNHQVPLDEEFKDETGKPVRLGDYFGKRPVILTMVYYQCKVLCPEEMNGLTGALEMVDLRPGKDFEIVTVSIDPTDTPAEGAEQKALYVKRYGHPETANGWHFLTGQQPQVNALAKAVGFSYVRVPGPDGRLAQFAHVSSIQLLTPEGRLAQYYLGVEYSPKDLRLGLVEASHHTIGSPVDNILTYCYHYDPLLNRHSLIVARIVQLGGVVTVLSLGSYMTVMFRRDIKQGNAVGTSNHV
ncbi:MAG TPA: SCO family protein [Acidisarcina sp.]